MRIAPSTFPLVLTLVGCAPSVVDHRETAASTEWRKGDFRVRFQAGPRGEDGRSYSFYDITHTATRQQERSMVKESAHTLGGFGSVTNGDPKNWIRIVQDSNGRALLVEEEIPNDCGPCSNYLWVHLDANGFVEGSYLRLPSKVTSPPGGIDYEYPKVRSLDGDVLRYDYSTGAGVTKRIDQIEKANHPTPPG